MYAQYAQTLAKLDRFDLTSANMENTGRSLLLIYYYYASYTLDYLYNAEEIKAARLLRRSNEATWRLSGLEVHRLIFRQHRDHVHWLIGMAKKAHYEQRISRGCCRETFAVLTDLTKSNNANLPAEPSADLANKFAAFFHKKIETIQEDIKAKLEFVSVHSDIHQEPN